MSTTREHRPAREVADDVALSRAARALLASDLSAGAYLQKLLRAEQWVDAIRYLARGLSVPQAVWWACLCARQAADGAPPEEVAALRAAVRWVVTPTEAHRRGAEDAAKAAGNDTPGGCAALAAVRGAEPAAAARLAAAAVLLAAGAGDDIVHWQRQYLYIGLDVESGALEFLQR